MAEPKSGAEIRDRFKVQLTALKDTAKANDLAALLQGQRTWAKIDKNGWSGDLLDIEGISKAFDRQEIAQDFIDAIKDAANPGTTGDLEISQLQTDYLACQERAFRQRHASPCRIAMHAAARKFGHGHDSGVLTKGVLGFIESLLKLSKGGGSQ